MDNLRRVFNILAALLILTVGGIIALRVSFSNFRLPFSFFVVLAGVPALAHLVALFLAWSSSDDRIDSRRAALGLSLSSMTLFVWFVLDAAIVEARVSGIVLASYGIHFLIQLVGTTLVLASAALNVAYFRSAVVTRPNYSLKRTAAGGLR